MQPRGEKTYFDSTAAPDDTMLCVMEAAIEQLVKSPLKEDLAELLRLRLVSRQWKQVVERVCVAHYNEVLNLVKRGVASGSLCDIMRARESDAARGPRRSTHARRTTSRAMSLVRASSDDAPRASGAPAT